ncbi:MAG: squalene synthase HpnC [Geminicoccaceae bacterium]|nr:MAG: squalene synthase HpnC [Geminicoccaceae bacterium]
MTAQGLADPFEAPSGKHAGSENFPVASWLIPRELRPHAMAFYTFARAIDDVADSDLSPEEKRFRLKAFDAALERPDEGGPRAALALARSLAVTRVSARHGRDLIRAFLRDVDQGRYRDWDDLMSYCALSAAPVGRYLMDLHGEDAALHEGSDQLCAALQVINHLQDCGDDYREMDRVYIPEPWLRAEGLGVEVLAEAEAVPGLRRVWDRLLDETQVLLAHSKPLAARIQSRGLALETAAIQALAQRLVAELRRRDPLRERVVLGRGTMAWVGLAGAFGAWRRRWGQG